MKHPKKKKSSPNKSNKSKKKAGSQQHGIIGNNGTEKNWVNDRWHWLPLVPPQPQQEQQPQQQTLPHTSKEGKDDDPSRTTTTMRSSSSSSNYNISIVSWNVLANSYCSSRSHRHLPLKFQRHVFDRPQRQHHVRQILRKLVSSTSTGTTKTITTNNNNNSIQADIIALQEVDEPLQVKDLMNNELDMDGIETPTTSSGKDGRMDACALYYRRTKWNRVEHEFIRLDDIATRMVPTTTTQRQSSSASASASASSVVSDETTTATNNNNNHNRNNTYAPNLQGIQSSLIRNNMALMVRLQLKEDPTIQIVVVVVHLYWNPLHEYVKLCQVHYVLKRAKEFCQRRTSQQPMKNGMMTTTTTSSPTVTSSSSSSSSVPLLLCGDFNSLPHSAVHDYLVRGVVNGKRVSPWYCNPSTGQVYLEVRKKNKKKLNNDTKIETTGGGGGDDADHDDEEEEEEEGFSIFDGSSSSSSNGNGNDPKNEKEKESSNKKEGKETATSIAMTMENLDLSSTSEKDDDDAHKKNMKNNASSPLSPALLQLDDTATSSLITPHPPQQQQQQQYREDVRYLLDYTLNRFCRWLRILGFDATLETEEEEKLRTRDGKLLLFDKCRKEGRCLVTTSTKLMLRQNCPPGAYLLNPKSLKQPEVTLVHLLLSHGVTLEPSKFLNRCVVCNGHIERVHDDQTKRDIFATHQAPESLQTNLEVMNVYQCIGCGQGYWWDDRPTSSASRVMNQATKLLELCIIGGVPVNTNNMAMFKFVDVERLRNWKARDRKRGGTSAANEGEDDDPDWELKAKVSTLSEQRLEVLEWLQQTELKCPFGGLTSAYKRQNGGDGQPHPEMPEEVLPFTNVTSDFVGHLDYILYNPNDMKVTERLYVPTSFEELNDLGIRNGHLLPSNIWPSDHLAIGARLSLSPVVQDSITNRPSTDTGLTISNPDSATSPVTGLVVDSTSRHDTRAKEDVIKGMDLFCAPVGDGPPPPALTRIPVPELPGINHGQRCGCGCVPPTPSLFEMAELRKQARLKKKQEQEQQQQK